MRVSIPEKLSKKNNRAFRDLIKKHFHISITLEQTNQEAFRLMEYISKLIESRTEYFDSDK